MFRIGKCNRKARIFERKRQRMGWGGIIKLYGGLSLRNGLAQILIINRFLRKELPGCPWGALLN